MLELKRLSVFIGTRIEFGVGVSGNAGFETGFIGAKKVFLVTNGNLVRLGLVDNIIKSIKDAGLGYLLFDEVM
jgi:choline dehydrogenase